MLYLEKMAARHITSANYITSVNGMVHPDRVLPEHDFLYMLEGEMEVFEDGTAGRPPSLWKKTVQSGKPSYVFSCTADRV